MSPNPETRSVLPGSIDAPAWRGHAAATLLLTIFTVLCANIGSALLGLIILALVAAGSGLPVIALPL
jgi:hypothetical protein